MPLERIRRRPARKKLVPYPTPAERLPLPLPGLRLFTDESAFWVEQWHTAANPHQGIRAHDLAEGLHGAAELGGMVHFALSRNMDWQEPARAWYNSSMALLAYAGLCRATWAHEGIYNALTLPPIASTQDVYADYHPKEPLSCGLHGHREQLSEILGVDLPAAPTLEKPAWLMGDSFYAMAFGQATPTHHFAARYEATYGNTFEAAAYLSVVPILKAEVVFG